MRTTPGIAAASLFLAVMIALMLGMWWHAGLTSPGAFGNAFRNLRLGKVPVIMTGLVYLLAQAAGSYRLADGRGGQQHGSDL
mgnify:CR=1 FL=1